MSIKTADNFEDNQVTEGNINPTRSSLLKSPKKTRKKGTQIKERKQRTKIHILVFYIRYKHNNETSTIKKMEFASQ